MTELIPEDIRRARVDAREEFDVIRQVFSGDAEGREDDSGEVA
jgi:hypothetical protein